MFSTISVVLHEGMVCPKHYKCVSTLSDKRSKPSLLPQPLEKTLKTSIMPLLALYMPADATCFEKKCFCFVNTSNGDRDYPCKHGPISMVDCVMGTISSWCNLSRENTTLTLTSVLVWNKNVLYQRMPHFLIMYNNHKNHADSYPEMMFSDYLFVIQKPF